MKNIKAILISVVCIIAVIIGIYFTVIIIRNWKKPYSRKRNMMFGGFRIVLILSAIVSGLVLFDFDDAVYYMEENMFILAICIGAIILLEIWSAIYLKGLKKQYPELGNGGLPSKNDFAQLISLQKSRIADKQASIYKNEEILKTLAKEKTIV